MRLIIVVLSPLFLSGCFFPAWVTYLSFAADGVSLIATGKSTTDLALSAAAEQDCAILRILEDGTLCRQQGEFLRPGSWPMTVIGVAGNSRAGAPLGPDGAPAARALPEPGAPRQSVRPSVDGDRTYEHRWPVQFTMEPPTPT